MRRIAKGLTAVALVLVPACGGSDANPLAAFAGTWSLTAYGEQGDTVASSVLVASEDAEGWTFAFPEREPIALHIVSTDGDSVVTRSDTYESVLEAGVQVTTEVVLRVQGDQLTGRWLAHRTVMGPDSVLRGMLRGRRLP